MMTLILTVIAGLAVGYAVVSWLSGPRADAGEKSADLASPAPGGIAPDASSHWSVILDVPIDATTDEIFAAHRRGKEAYDPVQVASLGPEIRAMAEQKSKLIDLALNQALAERKATP